MKKIWITWERQRRSIELSRAFEAKYYELLKFSSQIKFRPLRYAVLSLRTIKILSKERPDIVFCQNPSVILATLSCIVRRSFGYKLVVDRHSNFMFKKNPYTLKYILFQKISNYTIRKADITIVTNKFLYDWVKRKGGNGFILEDKLPDLKPARQGLFCKQTDEKVVTYISTFSPDEPVSQVIKAGQYVKENWQIMITGNYQSYSYKNEMIEGIPANVKLTGYLPEKEYQNLLDYSKIIMVLTTMNHTLNCGAYEGISLLKPLVLSDTNAIRSYFYKGVVYTRNEPLKIGEAINMAINKYSVLSREIKELSSELRVNWDKKFNELNKKINGLF